MKNRTPIIQDAEGRYATARPVTAEELVAAAEAILRQRCDRGSAFTSPESVRRWMVTRMSALEHEIFGCLFLDTRHRVITFEELFRGTIDGASVHPREVVKAALSVNAAAVILAHNHPSGVPEPSDADRRITRRLTDALALVDVRVLDHFIIGGAGAVSFAERGLI